MKHEPTDPIPHDDGSLFSDATGYAILDDKPAAQSAGDKDDKCPN